MKCPKCGAEVREGAKFCGSCGAPYREKSLVQGGAKIEADPPPKKASPEPPSKPEAAQAAAPGSSQTTPKKSKKGLLIGCLIAVLVVLLILAGIGVWGYFKLKKWAEETSKVPTDAAQYLDTEPPGGAGIMPPTDNTVTPPPDSGVTPPKAEEESHPDDASGKEIPGVPRYPGSVRTSYNEDASGVSAGYHLAGGISADTIINYYHQILPGQGFTLERKTAGKEILFKDASGKLLQVWIFFSDPSEGTDYVIEYPPLNPNQ